VTNDIKLESTIKKYKSDTRGKDSLNPIRFYEGRERGEEGGRDHKRID